MVRSLLRSSVLQRSSSIRLVLLVLGICVLLASVPLWLAMADYDYHYSFERERSDITFQQELVTTPYDQLSPETQRVVDAAIAGETFNFEDGTMDLPGFVSRGGTYYQFDARRAIDWLYPGSFVPILIGFVGLWLAVEAIQHERRSLGPRGY